VGVRDAAEDTTEKDPYQVDAPQHRAALPDRFKMM